MKVYLAGPMRGLPHFNFPAFHAAAAKLRADGYEVFNPAERDIARHGGFDFSLTNPTGSEEHATQEHGFNIREALADDLAYICQEANIIALLPGWIHSAGSRAEKATAEALRLGVIYL